MKFRRISCGIYRSWFRINWARGSVDYVFWRATIKEKLTGTTKFFLETRNSVTF